MPPRWTATCALVRDGPVRATPEVEGLLRELAPQVLGVIARRFGDFDAAEDAVQEALLAAARHWPREGVPGSPRAWLVQTAQRRMMDQIRSEQFRRRREQAAVLLQPPPAEAAGQDDTLIALTLRAVGGLTTAEIARAFLVPEPTMAQRISRAKQRIKASGVGFRMPGPGEWTQRLRSVLHVLYLIFNEGYASSTGPQLHRVDLSNQAIRLTRALHQALPDDAEVAGLLALMLLTDARRPARTGANGELVPLAEQDRAPQAQDTDWPQILALYGLLEQMTGNPVVTLNRALATAMVHGPAAGLALLEPLQEQLANHHRLDAVRAHLLEMAGDTEGRPASSPGVRHLGAARLKGVITRRPPSGGRLPPRSSPVAATAPGSP
jgi:predicted RNA polymerase sigma factor